MALVQSHATADIKGNSRHICELMTQDRDVGAGLIHLPETALSGYVKSQIPNRGSVDSHEVEDGGINIRETARQLEIWTVVGCNHRMARPNRPRNSLFVISDKGKLITSYDKRYCSHSDITYWYSAGHHANRFSVDGFRIDCALCIEIQFPKVFRQYEQLDVDCVVSSAFCDDPMFWTQAQGDAVTNNLWGSVTTFAQFGTAVQSGLIGPHGYGLARCEAKMTAQLLRVELDKKSPDLHVALTKVRPWRCKARSRDIYETDT